MNRILMELIGGAVILALVVALGMTIKINGARGADIKALKGDLSAAAAALKQASRDIERFSQKESAVAAEAARLCAAEGDNAFGRGVEVGLAVCEARR